MDIKTGFCRIETKDGEVSFGEITKVHQNYVLFLGLSPNEDEVRLKTSDFLHYEKYNEEDIPPYE